MKNDCFHPFHADINENLPIGISSVETLRFVFLSDYIDTLFKYVFWTKYFILSIS